MDETLFKFDLDPGGRPDPGRLSPDLSRLSSDFGRLSLDPCGRTLDSCGRALYQRSSRAFIV